MNHKENKYFHDADKTQTKPFFMKIHVNLSYLLKIDSLSDDVLMTTARWKIDAGKLRLMKGEQTNKNHSQQILFASNQYEIHHLFLNQLYKSILILP